MDAPRVTELIEYEVRIAARPETVFAYFTDPARMVEWMGTEATLDPRPGGVCRIDVTGDAVMIGEFVEVETPHRLVLSWGWERAWFETPRRSTVVEVSFTPDGEDTILRLSHGRLPAVAVDFHRNGWEHFLERLAEVASGADPGPDPWRRSERDLR